MLLPTGLARLTWGGPPMVPQILPMQVLKIGGLAIVAVPSEVSTMAGRRLKQTALAGLHELGVTHAVLSSLANSYSSYLTTREEYAKQWYEGACTPFGLHQLAGMQQEYAKLCQAMRQGTDVARGPVPTDVTRCARDFTVKVWFDAVPFGKRFGEVMEEPAQAYQRGDVITVRFWGAHPNNDYRIQDSFLVVERLVNGKYEPVAHDWDLDTLFRWKRCGLASSEITIHWDSRNAEPGSYRIRHMGVRKRLGSGELEPYEGVTETFAVKPSDLLGSADAVAAGLFGQI